MRSAKRFLLEQDYSLLEILSRAVRTGGLKFLEQAHVRDVGEIEQVIVRSVVLQRLQEVHILEKNCARAFAKKYLMRS